MTPRMLALAAGLLAGAGPALAIDWRPDGAWVGAAVGTTGTHMAGAGLVWDWDFRRMLRSTELTAHAEAIVNRWRYDAVGGGKDRLTQLALLPSLRLRPDRGQSRWFVELGIGASWMNHDFATPRKSFSTRWNFYDVLGIGYSFGAAERQHELGLRWTHISNCGIRDPNPGQDFVQLRYVQRF